MASAIPSFNSTVIRATAATGGSSNAARSRTDSNRASGRSIGSSSNSSGNWWGPLFGWSSDADYISSNHHHHHAPVPEVVEIRSRPGPNGSGSPRSGSSGGRFAPGCFTEEKAKELRKKTTECSTFHDTMYHSAIASRLASDLSDR